MSNNKKSSIFHYVQIYVCIVLEENLNKKNVGLQLLYLHI